MVEISLDEHIDSQTTIPLIITYSTLTCLVVSVHLLALLISTCMLPLLEANSILDDATYQNMHIYIEFAWILSTGFGIFLFLLEITIVCWVKFFFVKRSAAIAATIVIIPVIFLFCTFSMHFHRRLVTSKIHQHQNQLDLIESRLTIVKSSIVTL